MVLFIISFIIWALLHSITASRRTKAVVRGWIGDRAYEGWYRLFYNVFSFVTILPVFYILWTQVPGTVVTAALTGLDRVLSLSQVQRVWMDCAGPVCS